MSCLKGHRLACRVHLMSPLPLALGHAGIILATWTFPHFCGQPVEYIHLMSSLPGWACQYYSPNLDIPTFPWSACRVHLMLSLLGWACQYYSPNLTFPHFCGQPVGYIQGRQRGGCPNLKFYNDVFVGDTEKDICNILY